MEPFFTKEVDAVDIVANSITAAQIATGAISTDELAAKAVTALKIVQIGKLIIYFQLDLTELPEMVAAHQLYYAATSSDFQSSIGQTMSVAISTEELKEPSSQLLENSSA